MKRSTLSIFFMVLATSSLYSMDNPDDNQGAGLQALVKCLGSLLAG